MLERLVPFPTKLTCDSEPELCFAVTDVERLLHRGVPKTVEDAPNKPTVAPLHAIETIG